MTCTTRSGRGCGLTLPRFIGYEWVRFKGGIGLGEAKVCFSGNFSYTIFPWSSNFSLSAAIVFRSSLVKLACRRWSTAQVIDFQLPARKNGRIFVERQRLFSQTYIVTRWRCCKTDLRRRIAAILCHLTSIVQWDSSFLGFSAVQ